MTKETKERLYVIALVLTTLVIFNTLVFFGMSLEFVIVCAINAFVGCNMDKVCSYLRGKLFGGNL